MPVTARKFTPSQRPGNRAPHADDRQELRIRKIVVDEKDARRAFTIATRTLRSAGIVGDVDDGSTTGPTLLNILWKVERFMSLE